jgi:DNA-binding LacI/PurR family transcriptional regulator
MEKSVTVKEVALAAEVSTATVSRVLNRKWSNVPISKETTRKVLAAAKRLGYHSNFQARCLRTQKSQTVGLVVADIRDPYFTEIIAGIEKAAAELGYLYLLSSAEDNPHREKMYLDIFRLKRVDGIMIAGTPVHLDDTGIQELFEAKVPMVLIGRSFPDPKVATVTVDNEAGSELAMEHLLSLGHVRIAHISEGTKKPDGECRLGVYQRMIECAGLAYDPSLVVESGARPQDGYLGMKKLLHLKNPPTAVFCYNDQVAVGALKAVREAKLSVPEDISIVGFDDLDLCEYTVPPLTTVRQPRFDMGYHAMETFVMVSRTGQPVGPQVLEPELVIRDSTGPKP